MTDIKRVHTFQLLQARHKGVPAKKLMRIAESEENRKLDPEDYLHQFMISCPFNWTIGENIGIAPKKLSSTNKITSICERIVEISELPGQGGFRNLQRTVIYISPQSFPAITRTLHQQVNQSSRSATEITSS